MKSFSLKRELSQKIHKEAHIQASKQGLNIKSANSLVLNRGGVEGHKARGQGQGHKKNPGPRTAFPRTDTLEAKDRNARGQGQGPTTQAQVLSKKKGLHKKFSGDLKKKKKGGLHKNFSSDLHKKTFSKKFFKRSTKF